MGKSSHHGKVARFKRDDLEKVRLPGTKSHLEKFALLCKRMIKPLRHVKASRHRTGCSASVKIRASIHSTRYFVLGIHMFEASTNVNSVHEAFSLSM